MRLLASLLICLGSFGFSPPSAYAKATISASVDRETVGLEGVIRLRVSVQTDQDDGSEQATLTPPDLSDFEVIQQLQQRSYVLGATAQTLSLTLRPVRAGELKIGPFVLKADGKKLRSQTIAIRVTGDATQSSTGTPTGTPSLDEVLTSPPAESSGKATAPDRQAFLAWEVDDAEPYVGEQINAALYLYVNRSIAVQQHDFGSINLEGFWSETVKRQGPGRSEVVYIGGDAFTKNAVTEYRLFPLRAGEARLPAVKVDLVLGDRSVFGGRRQKAPRESPPLPVLIRPLPNAGRPADFVGTTVGLVTVNAKVDRTTISANEGVVVTLAAQIDGLASNLPDPVITSSDWRVLPSDDETHSTLRGEAVVGYRQRRWLLKPVRAGRLTVPPIGISYFDPKAGRYGTAQTPSLSIFVADQGGSNAAGGPNAIGSTPPNLAPGASLANGQPSGPLVLRGIVRDASTEPGSRSVRRPYLRLAVVLVAPLVFFGFVLRDRLRLRRQAQSGTRRRQQAAQVALSGLVALGASGDPRSAFAELARVFMEFLEVRLAATLRGATHEKVGQKLRELGLDEDLSRAIVAELQNAEFARFTPQDVRREVLEATVLRLKGLVTRADQAAERAAT